MSEIKIINAKKIYHDVPVIENLNITIPKGSLFTLLGPSGCGKTTLLRMIAGFNSIEGGEFYFDDTKINNMEPSKRNIGMVFQNYAIFPHLTVRDNVAFGLKQKKVPKEELIQQTNKYLELMQIAQYADRKPDKLSGGQQQRVCVARVLATSPKIILLDEPTSALDLSVQAQVLNFMKHIQQEYNIAYLFISHDLGVVKHMSEDIAIMHRGRFVEIGKRDQIYKNPMHIYTKRLLSAIPVVDVEHREQHKEERQRVEKEFLQDQDKWYEKDGRVLPLQKVGDRHFVALPKEMIKQELKEGE